MINISSIAVEVLGPHGKLISMSKTRYREAFPDHDVIFNCCVFDSEGVEIWFGDLDLTVDSEKVQALAEQIGTLCDPE